MVVASPDAFFFAIDPKTVTGVGAVIGGALGGAIEGLLASKKKRDKKKYMPQAVPLVEEMDLTDLSTEVTEHPEWPVTWEEGPVIIVPREAVQSLRTAWWLGGIELVMEGVAIRTATPVFKRKKMAAYLVDAGWEVAGWR
ncbi:MAG TPA: hypothetical protein DDY78_27300 [Planctomycetales bacterium]|jgi:hypothetical protein|nr:hypothetical protein [Planctomycetales bacterium]